MALTWNDLTFSPDENALGSLASAWSWLLKEPYHPVLFSTLGDMFFRFESDEAILWLNTGTSEIMRLADREADFIEMLRTDARNNWLMPQLVEQLRAAGKLLPAGYCYTYFTLPIFADGKYDTINFTSVPAWKHFKITGQLHQQLSELPDGTKVRFKVE